MNKEKDIHYEFWLLMNPYYCNKWLEGIDYNDLLKEYKVNKNKKMEKEKLTLAEREILCSQTGATWDLPFSHNIANKWKIPKFKNELKKQLYEEVLNTIRNDKLYGDYTAIDELLSFIPVENLIGFLPEEKGNKYKILNQNKVHNLLEFNKISVCCGSKMNLLVEVDDNENLFLDYSELCSFCLNTAEFINNPLNQNKDEIK